MEKVLKILKEHTMKIVLVLVVIFFNITTKGEMLKPSSFYSLITQNAYVFVLATGMMMCMLIKGNIDLSVGASICFIDACAAIMLTEKGMSVPVVLIITLAIGLVIGAVMGWLIAYVNIPPWIATLAGFLAFRGLGTAILIPTGPLSVGENFMNIFNKNIPNIGSGKFNITSLIIGIICCIILIFTMVRSRSNKIKKGYEAESLAALITKLVLLCSVIILYTVKLGQFAVGKKPGKGIPVVLIWVAVILLVYHFISSKTTLGRYFYAMGGNMEATRLSGINTKFILFLAYLNMQFLTVIAGWITLARLSGANGNMGLNYELDAISACIVGGVSAYGGSGNVFGMVVGAALIGVINLGMSIMGIDANWQKVVKGLVLLAAVVFEIANNRPKTKA